MPKNIILICSSIGTNQSNKKKLKKNKKQEGKKLMLLRSMVYLLNLPFIKAIGKFYSDLSFIFFFNSK